MALCNATVVAPPPIIVDFTGYAAAKTERLDIDREAFGRMLDRSRIRRLDP